MKYLRNFDKFKKSKQVNEELLGGLLNWFKKMWDKSIKDIEALSDNPNKIKEWIINNALNPKDDTNVFSQVIKEFEKKPTANDQDCLSLVDNLLDPETGSLGKQGIGVLLSNKAFQGEKLKAKRAMLEYIVNTARNQTIAKVKFAGGPTDGKIDPKKKTVDLKDTNHLPDVKKILVDAKTDEKVKKDKTDNWVKTVMIPMIQNFVKIMKEDDIRASLEKQGIKLAAGDGITYEKLKELYDKKTPILYLRDGKKREDWDKLTDDQKKATHAEPAIKIVNSKIIDSLTEDSIIFKDKDGKEFKKEYADVITPTEGEKVDGQDDLVNTLKALKTKNAPGIKKLDDVAKLYIDKEANKGKIDQIEKIIGTK